MRIVLGLLLAITTSSSALSADFSYRSVPQDEPITYAPRRVVTVRRTTCIRCPGSRLPLDHLRTPYQAQLPLGGLGRYCPPELETQKVVLVRKG
jgi:hypothetical protein